MLKPMTTGFGLLALLVIAIVSVVSSDRWSIAEHMVHRQVGPRDVPLPTHLKLFVTAWWNAGDVIAASNARAEASQNAEDAKIR